MIDRRGQGGGGGLGGGLFMLIPFLIRHPLGLIVVLVLVVGSVVMGMFGTGGSDAPAGTDTPQVAETRGANVKKDDPRHFVSFVLDDNQKVWGEIFARGGRTYRNAKLVLFTGATSTACGSGEAATGPFYCPNDERAYIDLSFYDELASRFGARGDFAQAYVLAHEVGHHVQKVLGISAATRGLRGAERKGESSVSVRLELQADCFAGIWAHSTRSRGLLEEGDVDEALRAATAIGDDRLQKRAKGVVTPETFTHGSAEQRARWFRTGLERGEVDACDTLKATDL